jgi:hypothetical protein
MFGSTPTVGLLRPRVSGCEGRFATEPVGQPIDILLSCLSLYDLFQLTLPFLNYFPVKSI